MGKFHIETYVVGNVGTNCYFLVNDDDSTAIIVDPGAQAPALKDQLLEEGLTPLAILITHAHEDHIGGAEYLHDEFNIPRYISEPGKETMADPEINMSGYIGGQAVEYQADEFLKDGQEKTIGAFTFRTLYTPGHTPCGACFYFPNEMTLFSGDTLFFTSVGRTDFPGGSMGILVRSIRERLMVLPDITRVYPGHGEMTTIGQEKIINPFIGM